MSIVIIGGFTFPHGSAATNRVHTYAKGFVENGESVHVICFGNRYNFTGNGTINGVNYYDTFSQARRSRFFVVRTFQKFIKYFRTIHLLRKINRKEKIIVFNTWLRLLHWQLFMFLIAKYFKVNIILERNEHPLVSNKDLWFKGLQDNFKLLFEKFFSHGIFCISQYLVEFYRNRGFEARRLFLVPSTVDPSRFLPVNASPFHFRYIGYFGGLTFKRDNVDLLIHAFAKISKKFPEVRLVLGGFCSATEKKQLHDLINRLNITDKVEVLKYLERDVIINYISHSHILVMARNMNLASQASFPSKLTEYLATGKPVVTVNVGEISEYLTDGENAFLVKAGDIDALADKLIFVLENYELAKEAGKKGKELTNTVFNYNFQAKRMLEFIYRLKES